MHIQYLISVIVSGVDLGLNCSVIDHRGTPQEEINRSLWSLWLIADLVATQQDKQRTMIVLVFVWTVETGTCVCSFSWSSVIDAGLSATCRPVC